MQFTLNSFHVMSHYFLLNKTPTDILCFIFLFAPFASVTSSSSKLINEYFFYFNPTNSLIIFPLNSSFILPITFLLTGSKNFEFDEYSLKSKKSLS